VDHYGTEEVKVEELQEKIDNVNATLYGGAHFKTVKQWRTK